jgi:hypothetical protein
MKRITNTLIFTALELLIVVPAVIGLMYLCGRQFDPWAIVMAAVFLLALNYWTWTEK